MNKWVTNHVEMATLLDTTYNDILGAAPSTDELDNFFGNLKGMMDGI